MRTLLLMLSNPSLTVDRINARLPLSQDEKLFPRINCAIADLARHFLERIQEHSRLSKHQLMLLASLEARKQKRASNLEFKQDYQNHYGNNFN